MEVLLRLKLKDGFNPPPAVRPGETFDPTENHTQGNVSIRPRR